jgi:flagellar biogenesis protein FliO
MERKDQENDMYIGGGLIALIIIIILLIWLL